MSIPLIHIAATPANRDLIRKIGAGDPDAIKLFQITITETVDKEIDRILEKMNRKSTGHKDFFGKELFEGDVVALLQKSGSSSVYIKKGTITGRTDNKVKVNFESQFGSRQDSVREPYNVIKS